MTAERPRLSAACFRGDGGSAKASVGMVGGAAEGSHLCASFITRPSHGGWWGGGVCLHWGTDIDEN